MYHFKYHFLHEALPDNQREVSMAVLLGSQFILYTHLIIKAFFHSALQKFSSLSISSKHNKTNKSQTCRPVLWSNNLKLYSRLILHTYHTDLSISGPEGCSGKKLILSNVSKCAIKYLFGETSIFRFPGAKVGNAVSFSYDLFSLTCCLH